jgi:hypothetical protein
MNHMNRLRSLRSIAFVGRRRRKYLAAMAVILVAVGAFAVPAAFASHHARDQDEVGAAAGPQVHFRKMPPALFLCSNPGLNGKDGPSTATITTAFGIITANVTLTNALPNTTYMVTLEQVNGFGACAKQTATYIETDGSGRGTGTVNDSRAFGVAKAFVWASGAGDVEITTAVTL